MGHTANREFQGCELVPHPARRKSRRTPPVTRLRNKKHTKSESRRHLVYFLRFIFVFCVVCFDFFFEGLRYSHSPPAPPGVGELWHGAAFHCTVEVLVPSKVPNDLAFFIHARPRQQQSTVLSQEVGLCVS